MSCSYNDNDSFWLTIEDSEMKGGYDPTESDMNTEELENQLNSLLATGNQFGGMINITEKVMKRKSSKKTSKKGSLNGGKRKTSKKSSKKTSKKGSLNGGKRKTFKKSSKKASKKGSKKMGRTLPPALLLFQELVKYVASKIGKGGRPAMTIAGQVKRDLLEKKPGLEGKDMIEEAKKHFDSNIETYKKMM
jgi:hypothetical protein